MELKPFLAGFFFSIWVFFHEHSRIKRLQEKGEGIFLTPHYHFHPLHRHLDISWAMHIVSSRTRTGNLWFPSASCKPLSYAPLNSTLGSDINVNCNFENFKNTNVHCNFMTNFDDLNKSICKFWEIKSYGT